MTASREHFFTRFAQTLNSGQARSVILCGNIYDLFWTGREYVPLIPYLQEKCSTGGLLQLVYELNGPVRMSERDRTDLRNAWVEWKAGTDINTLILQDLKRKRSEAEFLGQQFDQNLKDSIGNATLALEFLRQLTICSRERLRGELLIIIEAADMLLPAGNGNVADLNDRQLRRISIMQDWFGDPSFVHGGDSVCLVAESRSMIHPRIARLPQVVTHEVPAPDTETRLQYIEHFQEQHAERPVKLWSGPRELADFTAGLSIHALRQLLLGAAYANETLGPAGITEKVQEFIQSQLGEDVVEFKKPEHTLKDVVGFTKLKEFLNEELIPRFQSKGEDALPGAAVAGPIGGGKTFIFEAVAAELDMPVLVLKSIRSQWFGQTDVIFERLRRVLESLERVLIFVDEADTQFGGIDEQTHDTERRLTGKIQAMMSDPRLRGCVFWLLMTARIHRLSPDIRRPGRVGDLIIPVLDPTGEDRRAFVRWMLKPVGLTDEVVIQRFDESLPAEYSAAAFASLRSRLKAEKPQTEEEVTTIIHDQLPPAIGLTRRYQTLQALVNCTRRRLLPDPTITREHREVWELELRQLEERGVR